MSNTRTAEMPVPGDSSGRAIGIVFRNEDVEEILRQGVLTVRQTMPTLAAKADEVLAEIDGPNSHRGRGYVIIKIDRTIDEALLLKNQLKVVACDEGKILALLAALDYVNSARARELRKVVATAVRGGGIPLRLEGEPKLGGSVYIRIFDQSLELKLSRPA